MPHSFGYRARTRSMFSKNFREHGQVKLSTYMVHYKVGDVVDIVANAAEQRGMPHKFYHGRTGVVFNVTKSAVGVIINKRVGNRYIAKRVNIRVEHIKHSKSRLSFLQRVKDNENARIQAKKDGTSVSFKRLPAQPRESRPVSSEDNYPSTIQPIPYDTLI
ncbi:60S ribosomal protein L21A [Tieghemiomyces parasiticus]|uniref:60S ribosomal protein L21A n=1 Tax=Tieghemiomyces parasiticus TaxID=78921 RepID=A0A9W8A957_9FUNG|nr:60S ribosomal protein L21A [Tieghemiomyces parasiticus]